VQHKPGDEAAFIAASIKNCQNSIKEGGIHRFDLLQNAEDTCNFILVEAYNSPEGPIAHKNTAHYKQWASEVAGMMARPRSAIKYASLYPEPLYWHRSAEITHPGEHSSHVNSYGGAKGFSAVASQSFGFLSPKLSIGRDIAEKALANSIKVHFLFV
jgi:autoinducer 2-degrading protein